MNHSHSPANSRPSSLTHPLPNNYHSNHYGSVKVEDDHYGSQSNNNHHPHGHHNGQPSHYHASNTLPPFAQTVSETGDMDSWHSYSAERAQVHR
jgi:hypothetical protein